jgi:hypothetical protein
VLGKDLAKAIKKELRPASPSAVAFAGKEAADRTARLGSSNTVVGSAVSAVTKTVGHVRIERPQGATGSHVFSLESSTPRPATETGIPTAQLPAEFQVGSEPGQYVPTFSLNNGNSVQVSVNAHDSDPAESAGGNSADLTAASFAAAVDWIFSQNDATKKGRRSRG